MSDAQVERGIQLRIVELHQHVRAANADLGAAERHKGGDIEGADANDVECRVVGGEAETAGIFVQVIGGRDDTGPRQQFAALSQNPALG
jgi:hypothetical protein